MKLYVSNRVPKEIESDFMKQSARTCCRIITMLAVMSILLQLVNIGHVLIISTSKLGTLNNRIYFGFYCFHLIVCVLLLLLKKFICASSNPQMIRVVHNLFYLIWLLWSFGLNYYELLHPNHGNLSISVTCLLGTAICMQYTPLDFFSLVIPPFFAFCAASAPIIQLGGLINMLIAFVMAAFAFLMQFHLRVTTLQHRTLVESMNTDLESKNNALSVSLHKFSFILDQIDNILFDWDMEKGEILFSSRWEEYFGYDRLVTNVPQWFSELTFLTPAEKQKIVAAIKESLVEHTLFETEVHIQSDNGRSEWYILRFQPQCNLDGSVHSCIGFLTSIHHQKEALANLRTRMYQDILTKTLNRKGMQKFIEKELALSHPAGSLLLLLVDLDDFKQINDTYGHPCGDAILLETSQVLSRFVSDCGCIGRIGGDEFMVLYFNPGYTPFRRKDDITELGDKLQTLISHGASVCWEEQTVCVRFSIGGVFSVPSDTFHTMYQRADQALYHAKALGKGQYYLDHQS